MNFSECHEMHFSGIVVSSFSLLVYVCRLDVAAVHGSSFFKEKPTNQSVLLGGNVLLRCSANQNESGDFLQSQWKINDGTLLGIKDAGQRSVRGGRYIYVSDNPHEKHLRIENVTLVDDGLYECQMKPRDLPGFRASSFVNVIVPPTRLILIKHKTGSVVNATEGRELNITCMTPNAKPQAELNWFINGKNMADNVVRWTKNLNLTVSSFAALVWKPRRIDHEALLTCEATHPYVKSELKVNVSLNVFYPSETPIIEVLNHQGAMKPGDNVTLRCEAVGGNPPPRLIWLFNHNPISNTYNYYANSKVTTNVYSMIVDGNDNGAFYECHSSNSATELPLYETVRLSVVYPPVAVDIYGESKAKIDQSVKLQCRSKLSNPPSKISWLINGQPIQSTDDANLEQTTGTISISNLTINPADVVIIKHQITVQCIARNDEGITSKQHVIRVLSPPMQPVIHGMEGLTLLEGDMLNLTCEAHGGNPLAILSWFRGVEKIKEFKSSVFGDASQSSVTVVLDRTMNNQQIRCEAENGAVDEPLVALKTISVYFSPRRIILRQEERGRSKMVVGEATKLICIATSSNPIAEISWSFPNSENAFVSWDEKKTNRSSHEFGGFEVESVIEFIPLEEMNGREVECVASHSQWTDRKAATFPLNIFYPPKMTVKGPITIVVGEGDSFKENFTLRANPAVTNWRWRKNGLPFENVIGRVAAKGSMLSSHSLNKEDAGLYSLVASNAIGMVNVSIDIVVEYSAYITHITSPVVASAGEEVVMECEVDGIPKRDGMVKWVRNGLPIDTFTLVGQTRAVIRLNASLQTAGVYTCIADNAMGKVNTTNAYLLVNRAPSINRQPLFLRSAGPLGGSAHIRCQASAVPDIHFQWIIHGHSTPLRRNSTKYIFSNVQIDHSTFEGSLWISSLDHHDYQHPVKCIAMNRYGDDSVDIRVVPPTAPDTPLSLRVFNVTKSSLSLSWIPNFDGGAQQIFEIRFQNPPEKPKEIRGLEPARLYEISIRALNKRGLASEFSHPPISVYTKDEFGLAIVGVAKSDPFPPSMIIIFGLCCIALLIINCILLCYMQRRKKRRKMQEKTEMIRKTNGNGGEVRPVQMYGALACPGAIHRAESVNTNKSDLGPEPTSEDDQSLRTMIEVNPNGCVQQMDPSCFYERDCLVEYEFDPQLYGDVVKSSTLRRGPPLYVNMRYPDVSSKPMSISGASMSYSEAGSLSRVTDISSADSPRRIHKPRIIDSNMVLHTNNNTINGKSNNPTQMLSTFVQQGGIHTTPLNFAHIDGDLV